jgi:hypothetical protein
MSFFVVKMSFGAALFLLLVGCAGNSSTPTPGNKTVSVKFGGVPPSAVATQMGSASFMLAPISADNTVSLTLPAGTTNYAIAYVCSSATLINERVIQADAQDATSLRASCPLRSQPTLGAATGTVDASAIAGTAKVEVVGRGGLTTLGISGAFNVNLETGTSDVAFLAKDSNSSVLAVKILRSQNIPGTLNDANAVVFGPSDATTKQPFTINNVPAGLLATGLVEYATANNTSFVLNSAFNNATGQYSAVPAAAAQTGDSYRYESIGFNPGNPPATVGIAQITNNGGGPVAMTLPNVGFFGDPTPATFPTFTFNYSGFPAGLSTIGQAVLLDWDLTTTNAHILSVTATPHSQGGTTLTVPDLSALSGFPPPAPSGTKIDWVAEVLGGTAPLFSQNTSANESTAFVENTGSYTQP